MRVEGSGGAFIETQAVAWALGWGGGGEAGLHGSCWAERANDSGPGLGFF